MKSNTLKTSKFHFRLAALAPLVAGLLNGTAANAATIESDITGDWEVGATWVGGVVPALVTDEAFVMDGDTVTMDRDQTADTADDTTLGPVQVNTGGTLNSWYGNMNTGPFTFNGGAVFSNQRTLNLETPSITVTANGGLWGTKKQQNKTAYLISPILTGTGDLTGQSGIVNQIRQVRIPDMTGFTGKHISIGAPKTKWPTTVETGAAWVKFTNSIAKENASFGMVLNSSTYDWAEASGGTDALDDGTYYDGYDMTDENIELWVTDLTIGGFKVPGRPGGAYTYAELAAMNGGDVANYLRSDGTDGLIGVNGTPIPFIMTDITFDGTTATATWNSKPNQPYFVYFSSDLVNWEELDDSASSATTSATYLDMISDRFALDGLPVPGQGFYRVEENNAN